MSPAEAVATIEAIEQHDLSLSYLWILGGWVCTGRTDICDPTSDAQPRRFRSVVDAVADWMVRNEHPWPVRVIDAVGGK